MKIFYCDKCRQILYFENVLCMNCDSELGFLPHLCAMSTLEQVGDNRWKALVPKAKGRIYKKCRNYIHENVCNWLVAEEEENDYCLACELNITIPNLEKKNNRFYWYRLEVAKRRLFYTLLKLALPIKGRKADPEHGLGFEFLEEEAPEFKETKKVITGHANGLITINIDEADDAKRVKMRLQMQEEYRTILGHFRHEIGHYYWARLIDNSPYLEECRGLFGDERADYNAALKKYYDKGPHPEWKKHFVSAYSSAHPAEDWAETWAHYLHMIDTLETAKAWGLTVSPSDDEALEPTQSAQQPIFVDNHWQNFDEMYGSWTWVTCAVNSMNRSMGQRDLYPFVLSQTAVFKLRFIDKVIKNLTQ